LDRTGSVTNIALLLNSIVLRTTYDRHAHAHVTDRATVRPLLIRSCMPDLRFRAGEVAAGEADAPAGERVRGHLRLRAARVHDARRVQREDGRVRSRRRAARAPHRPPRRRHRQAQPRRMGMYVCRTSSYMYMYVSRTSHVVMPTYPHTCMPC
jgi:hypothetical protein